MAMSLIRKLENPEEIKSANRRLMPPDRTHPEDVVRDLWDVARRHDGCIGLGCYEGSFLVTVPSDIKFDEFRQECLPVLRPAYDAADRARYRPKA